MGRRSRNSGSLVIQTYLPIRELAKIDHYLASENIRPTGNSGLVREIVELVARSIEGDLPTFENSLRWLDSRGYELSQVLGRKEDEKPTVELYPERSPERSHSENANDSSPSLSDEERALLETLDESEREVARRRLIKMKRSLGYE